MNQIQDTNEVKVTPDRARSCIIKALKAKKVPMLWGSPGIGKSDIVHGIAKEFNLKVLDLRLGQSDRTDLLGFPRIDDKKNRAGYVPMDTFPIEDEPVPAGFNGWLLFLDELTSAEADVQAASYKLILDRMVGLYKLHPKVVIVAAGNLESDNAVVNTMSTALQSRMVHLVLELDSKKWVNWAIDHGVDHRIIDFIQFKPSNLHNFDPNHTDKTYSCPRTVVFMDDILKACNGDAHDPDFLPLASGCVSTGVAREFQIYCDIYGQLPKINDILAAPMVARMPDEPGHLFALSGMLGTEADEKNIDKLLPYIVRMSIEFQVVTLRYVIKKGGQKMMANPTIAQWIKQHGAELF